jgi:hypothetical protein
MADRGVPTSELGRRTPIPHLTRLTLPARSRALWVCVGTGTIGTAAGFGAAVLLGHSAALTQPVATLAAGLGALTAGALAYLNGERGRAHDKALHNEVMGRERERHSQDTAREHELALRERYTTIAGQIAHDSAAIRQAGNTRWPH